VEIWETPVLHRSCSALRLLLLLILCNSASLRSQDAPSDGRVFKAKAQIVVLDVVVTGKNGVPVPGLHKENFQASEDGHQQTITHFEEHSGSQPLQAPLPPLPPNVFSNISRTKPGDSVTVLLLDSLNTPLADQSTVRLQTLKFLKTLQPGQRMAIFTLSSQLRFIQGFTDDPAVLVAAINRKGTGAQVQTSPLLGSNAETAAAQETAAAMRAAPGGEGEDAAEALEQFMANQNSARSDARLKMTLQAFQELAHYLGGIPGRKNVAWFSGAFPVVLLPDVTVRDSSGPQRDDQAEVRKTDALLASAQVAIYPISSEGVATGSFYSASTDARQNQQQVTAARQNDLDERNSAHSAMDEIAKYTGGKAFYNTNGLQDALANVTNNGSHYYTLTYTSPNKATDGRYRKIQLKLANAPGYQLAYRQGYYADDAKSSQAGAAAKSAPGDPLSPLMRPGLPDSTQIPLTVQVLRDSDQPAAAADPNRNQPVSPQNGDNHDLKGPLTRYTVHFFIPPGGLLLDLAPNGHRQLSVDAALLVYDHDGKSLNWMLRQINLEMDAAHYATAVANGVNFRLQIDAPDGGIFLRGGVYDLKSNLAGTLEVPLRTIVNPSPAAGSR
jgi:VWFA-related protein